jgi:murein L,D-transpeptidase YcbB/YkuD
MSLRFARTSLLALALAVAPVTVSSFLPGSAEAQTFSALRQAIAEASSTDESLATFYRAQDFQPIWTSSAAIERRSALIAALEQAEIHGLPTARYDIDALREAFAQATNPWARGQADVMATQMFLQYANDVHSGFLDPGAIIPDIFQDLPRQDPLELLTAFMEPTPTPSWRACRRRTPPMRGFCARSCTWRILPRAAATAPSSRPEAWHREMSGLPWSRSVTV